MKKIKKMLTVFLAGMLMICVSIPLTGCDPITREDCIPETLGETEGLYLYYNNYRSLTDGSNRERLLNDITVDGVTYTVDEYYIEQIEYMTNKKEIFYSIVEQKEDEEEKCFLWHYNYDTKENGLIRASDYLIHVSVSDYYVLAYDRDYSSSTNVNGVLYDCELNLIQSGLENYYLHGNMLFSYTDTSPTFDWWKNGQFFSVKTTGGRLWHTKVLIEEKYAYLFPDYSVYAIDLDTGEYKQTTFEQGEQFLDCTTDYGVRVKSGEDTYFITSTSSAETEYENLPLSTGCYLWKLHGLEAARFYAFPKDYEVRFSSYSNEKYINFSTVVVPKWFNAKKKRKYGGAYYNVEKDKFIYGALWENRASKENFCIGEYEFYTDYKTYGALLFPDYCYYLHRIKDGKDEILQYYFVEDDQRDINPILFDDIHTK